MEQEPVQNPGTRVAGGAQPRPAEVSSAPTRMCVTRGLGVGRTPGPAGHGTERQRRHCRGTGPGANPGVGAVGEPRGPGLHRPSPRRRRVQGRRELGPASTQSASLGAPQGLLLNFFHKEKQTSCIYFHSGQALIMEDCVPETRLLPQHGAGVAEDAWSLTQKDCGWGVRSRYQLVRGAPGFPFRKRGLSVTSQVRAGETTGQ